MAYLIGARGGFGYGDYRADGDVHDEAWICLAPFRMGRPRCDPVVGMVMECRRGCAGAVVARGRGGAVGLGGTCGVDDFPAWDVDLLATSPHRHVDELLHHHADTESGRRNGNLSCSAWSSGRGVIVASARVARHRRRLSLCLGVLALSMGFVAGAVQVGHLNAFPTIARETVVRCHVVEGTGVQVCLLPEHESERSMLDSTVKRVFPIWRRAGIALPRLYSEQVLPGRKDAVELSVFSGMMEGSIATARLAAATGRPFCLISDKEETRPVEIIQYSGRIDAWLRQVARAAGLEVTEEGIASEDSDWARKLRTKSVTAQASAVRKMQEYLRGCPR